jgi:type IV secretory pathway VirB2 component (pilin)
MRDKRVMTIDRGVAVAAVLLASCLMLFPDLAVAQTGGSDAFSQAVTWFTGGPARGVASLAVAAVAVMLWLFMGSLRVAGMVLAGGLLLANISTIVGWMGF